MMQEDQRLEESERVVSPFAHTEATLPSAPARKGGGGKWLWPALIGLAVALFAGYFAYAYFAVPYRTIEAFPTAKYFESHRALQGARFKADLRVEADLGYKEGVGRLMAFTTREDTRALVVMVPPDLGDIYFTKGQNYLAELEVKDGGLISALSFRKN